jgi:DNA (cytosine-5)-methyltransferase 1
MKGEFSEIIIDSFAGGGGASTGIEMALQAMAASGIALDSTDVTIAINHAGEALAMHEANHPRTVHLEADIWAVDPKTTTKGRPVGLLWASPDCRHFSKAKGSAPVTESVRGLAWCVAHWAEMVQPRMIFLENVEEFMEWGPLMRGKKRGELVPDPAKAGQTFQKWLKRFKSLGYRVEWRILRACDYGAPTIRRRLYIVMRRDGQPIVWPEPTHGEPGSTLVTAGKRKPYRTAFDIIDWQVPCTSIFMDAAGARKYYRETGITVRRPLADASLHRIAQGVKRYVVESADPFIVTLNHSGTGFRGQGLGEPFCTVTKRRDAHGLVLPFVTTYYGEIDGRNDRGATIGDPLATVTTANRHGLVCADVVQLPTIAGFYGRDVGRRVDSPLGTVTTRDKSALTVATAVRPPLTTEQRAGARRVAKFLRAHGCWDGGECVIVGEHVIVDLGMRMLTPRELARAQGFGDDYILAAPYAQAKGGRLGETAQRERIGNSVCPPVAAALVGANYRPQVRDDVQHIQGWLFDLKPVGEAA